MFGVLVRARWRMAVNAARAAPPWHRAMLAVLSLFTLGLFARHRRRLRGRWCC